MLRGVSPRWLAAPAVLLIAAAALAQSPVGWPNPKHDSNIAINKTGAWLGTTGARTLTFRDQANPAGTFYRVWWRINDNGAAGAWNGPFAPTPATKSAAAGVSETFSYTGTWDVQPSPTTKYEWCVKVNDAVNQPVDGVDRMWLFRAAFEEPGDGSKNVSRNAYIAWRDHPVYSRLATAEKLMVLPSTDPLGSWTSGGNPRSDLVMKTVNTPNANPPATIYSWWNTSQTNQRLWWQNYDANYTRLQYASYQWRILYEIAKRPATATVTFNTTTVNGDTVTINYPGPPVYQKNIIMVGGLSGSTAQGYFMSQVLDTDPFTVSASGASTVELTWKTAGAAGNSATVTSNTGRITASGFAGGSDTSGSFMGPIYTFTPAWRYSPLLSNSHTCAIIYWSHPQGSKTADPEENAWSFEPEAEQLRSIHHAMNPGITTYALNMHSLANEYDTLMPTITGWPGWFTYTRADRNTSQGFSYHQQDRYQETVARALRAWLRDTQTPGNHQITSLKNIILLGGAAQIPPSFYYRYTVGEFNRSLWTHSAAITWLATDFFYTTQSSSDTVTTSPVFQVSRIPMTRPTEYDTTQQDGATSSRGASYLDATTAWVVKTRDYVALMNSDANRTAAYDDWFGRAVVACASTEYYRFYQFFSGFAQRLLSRRISPIIGIYRDAFSGLLTRRYDLYSSGTEELSTPANILRHLRASDSTPNDIPGFLYLLARGGSEYPSASDYGQTCLLSPVSSINATDVRTGYYDDMDNRGTNPLRPRPILVTPSAVLGNTDASIRAQTSDSSVYSLGQAGVLSKGGPIAVVGFSSGAYNGTATITRRYPDGAAETRTYGPLYLYTDEREGYTHVTLASRRTSGATESGVLSIENDGDTETAVKGKVEFVERFAEQYGRSAYTPDLGGLFNGALSAYITANSADFLNDERRVTTTIFGSTLLGDGAILAPCARRPASDTAKPVLSPKNMRLAATVSGYPAVARYNSQNMPVYVIPHSSPYNPTTGATVQVDITTTARTVRVRVLTPFDLNENYTPGVWTDGITRGHWAPLAGYPADGVITPVGSVATYRFYAYKPSIYAVIVQEENPKWTELPAGNPNKTDDWRWMKETWLYLQAVNDFTRNPDHTVNILVVDSDQQDRYYLNGNIWEEALKTSGGNTSAGWFANHVEHYYIDPRHDGTGLPTPLPATRQALLDSYDAYFASLGLPAGKYPVLPILNYDFKDQSPASPFKYQFWCTNVYTTGSTYMPNPNGPVLLQRQLYHGDLTPVALKAFGDTRGVVIYHGGDNNEDRPIILWPEDPNALAPPRHGGAGYQFWYDALPYGTAQLLDTFCAAGGRLFITHQRIGIESSTTPHPIGESPFREFVRAFQRENLGAETVTADTNYHVMNGLKEETLSRAIVGVKAADPPGQENAELTPGFTIYPVGDTNTKTVFTWSTSGGGGSGPADAPASIQKRLISSGGRSLFFGFPFEAIDNLGDTYIQGVLEGNTLGGRENVMRQVLEWLRNVPIPRASGTGGEALIVPANGATGVSLGVTMAWTRIPEALSYRLNYGTVAEWDSNAYHTVPVIDRDNPTFKIQGSGYPELQGNQQYRWRVDVRNVDDYNLGDVWTFHTVSTAVKATEPDPFDGEDQVAVAKVLNWNNPGDWSSFDIVGERWVGGAWVADPNLSAAGLTAKTFTPASALQANALYRWRIDTYNELSANPTQGDWWQFSTITPPDKPAAFDPANGASGVLTTKVLSWTATPRTDYYDIFIWTGGNWAPGQARPPQNYVIGTALLANQYAATIPATVDPSFIFGQFQTSTAYSWEVWPRNAAGRYYSAADTPMTFTTAAAYTVPGLPSNPHPASGDLGAYTRPTLSWDKGAGASKYVVTFWRVGTNRWDPTTVTATVYDSKAQGQWFPNRPSWQPAAAPAAALIPGQSYNWDVLSYNSSNVPASGVPSVWTFTVGAGKVNEAAVIVPAPNATGVSTLGNVLFDWADMANVTYYSFYLWEDGTPETLIATNLTTSEYTYTTPLKPNTTYHWRVNSTYNPTTTGDIITFTTSGQPHKVTGMVPADQAVGVALDTVLTWNAAQGATTYNVYLGINSLPATPTASGLVDTQFKPSGDLVFGATYKWRVDSVASDGTSTTGDTYSFMAGIYVDPPTQITTAMMTPALGATNVSRTVTLSW
ncbi:MAG TPA: hypothetical protein P5137_01825, partial [Candidatus Brocadiia bacterium]|nr:hypothetical protein [Candidatus Brocadiia bacterium]